MCICLGYKNHLMLSQLFPFINLTPKKKKKTKILNIIDNKINRCVSYNGPANS